MTTLASRASDSYLPVDLILDGKNVQTKEETLITGQNLAEYTVLGRITRGAATSAIVGTGNGVVGAVTLGVDAIPGVYKLTCITAAANAGVFQVEDPEGHVLPPLTVAVAYTGDHINVTVADGATDFLVGDVINITVAAGSNKVKKCVLTATDGSEVPVGILCNTIDATSADKACAMYVAGDFNEDKLVWDATFSTDTLKRTAFDRTPIIVRPSTYSVG